MSLEYLRSFRVNEVAMFDYIMSYIGAAIIIQLFGFKHSIRNYLLVLPISVIAHFIVGQETTITKRLTNSEVNLTKISFILIMILFFYLT